MPASSADRAVAAGYDNWADKGPVVAGRRLTIMAARSSYAPREELRVVHALEVVAPGPDLYPVGPKPSSASSSTDARPPTRPRRATTPPPHRPTTARSCRAQGSI